jgi:hypothetical protein
MAGDSGFDKARRVGARVRFETDKHLIMHMVPDEPAASDEPGESHEPGGKGEPDAAGPSGGATPQRPGPGGSELPGRD